MATNSWGLTGVLLQNLEASVSHGPCQSVSHLVTAPSESSTVCWVQLGHNQSHKDNAQKHSSAIRGPAKGELNSPCSANFDNRAWILYTCTNWGQKLFALSSQEMQNEHKEDKDIWK